MEEHKYETIEPDSERYKITMEDLKVSKKHRRKMKNTRKKKRASKILIALLLVFAILIGGGAFLVNNYLGKMNYGDIVGEIDPSLDKDETLEFEGQEDADNSILENLKNKAMWYDDRILNVLLVGYDLGDMADKYFPRSDSMILVSINTINNSINMVSFSRASYVSIPGHGNRRLNTAHAYGGATLLVDTIQQNYKIRIDGYAIVDFSGFSNIIDVLGGVDISMSAAEARYIVGKSVAGTYHLNGESALAYSRLRSIDNDRNRTGRQRNVLNSLVSKFKSASVSTFVDLAEQILPLVTTNFPKTEILKQATQLPKYINMPIHEDIIPHNAVPLALRDGMEVLILNWDEEKSYLHNLLYPDMIPQSIQENLDAENQSKK